MKKLLLTSVAIVFAAGAASAQTGGSYDKSSPSAQPSQSTTQSPSAKPTATNPSSTNPSARSNQTQGSSMNEEPTSKSTGANNTTKPNTNTAQQPAVQPSTSAQQKPGTQQPSTAQQTPSQQPAVQRAQTSQPAQQQQAGSTVQPGQVGAGGTLNKDQQVKVSAAFGSARVAPLTNVNFAVSVGTVIPGSVRLHPLPSAVIAIVPQYRGYDYFVVRDEIVIVEPRTKKIVTIIPSNTHASAPSRQKVTFTDKQRDVIRSSTRSRATTGAATRSTITVGERLPDTVELQTFDETVIREVPEIRTYRYVPGPGGVYLVDPAERTVIEQIEY